MGTFGASSTPQNFKLRLSEYSMKFFFKWVLFTLLAKAVISK